MATNEVSYIMIKPDGVRELITNTCTFPGPGGQSGRLICEILNCRSKGSWLAKSFRGKLHSIAMCLWNWLDCHRWAASSPASLLLAPHPEHHWCWI